MSQIITPVMGALTPVKYSLKLVDLLYNDTIYPQITNTSYEGAIKDSGDRVRVRTLGKISLSEYTKGMQLAAQELTPTYEDLIIDQQWYFKFGVDDIDKIQNDVDAINEYAMNTKNDISEKIDTDILSYMRTQVNSANMLGTDYSTGTAAVTATTGAVLGAGGATFTAAMVGGIFTITGLTASYRVKTYTDAQNIVIEDLDSTGYSGGAVSATTYKIAGATHISATKSTIYKNLVDLSTKLNASLAPRNDRFVVVNSALEGILRQAPEFIPAVDSAYSDVVEKGLIGKIAGFKVIFSELVDGNNTTGYWYVAGTKTFCSFALQILKTSMIPSESDPNSFITFCKGLVVWGKKVFNGNRAHGAVLRAVIG